ncbi:hypothetical protein NBRC110019_19340 [Neptunitalea chrysea]|uniref:Uncharacterized protein n=1 Tax=Neptunitalea chrysea TaxID=1647581 RepID=A0A9W6EUQ9_9FLAO|nr:hypothetical protein [Neptunitalea chrysea]GLB52894.1 hypothetical protein NBRC110019_19340 [Neptunitalea chrysea]
MEKILIKRNVFTFILIGTIGLLISCTTTLYLPERFFLDTNVLIYDRYNEIGYIGSYPLTILFYNITGLKYIHFSIIGFMQYSIVLYILFKIGISKNFHKVSLKNALIYLLFIITAIYLSMPAKDFLNFVYVSLIIFVFKEYGTDVKKALAIGFTLLLIFAVFYRIYYLFIIVLSIGMFALSKLNLRNKRLTTIFISLMGMVFISLSYGVVKGKYISEETRYRINISRLGEDNANSMILSPMAPDTWYGELVSIFHGFFSVNLPVNGLKHLLSPHIVAFVIWQLLFFVVLFIRFGHCFKKGRKNNPELWLFLMLFSFFVVQGVFEPDLGSAIRHKAGIFPLIYYLFYYEDLRKKLR